MAKNTYLKAEKCPTEAFFSYINPGGFFSATLSQQGSSSQSLTFSFDWGVEQLDKLFTQRRLVNDFVPCRRRPPLVPPVFLLLNEGQGKWSFLLDI